LGSLLEATVKMCKHILIPSRNGENFVSKTSRILSVIFAILISSTIYPNSAVAVSQKISYYINGDCSDYYDVNGEYAFFEEEANWTCYITVSVKGPKPIRAARLQFWNGHKWFQESFTKTNSKGYANLNFDPTCNGGAYCDGTWQYRILLDPAPGQKSDTSETFEVTFYPGTAADYGAQG